MDDSEYQKLEDSYLRGLTEINRLNHQIRDIKRKLAEIRDNPKSWKAGSISGADQYQGLPSFLCIIDGILKEK